MVLSDSDEDQVPRGSKVERYYVPRLVPSFVINTPPSTPDVTVITMFNRLELSTGFLREMCNSNDVMGAVRINNYFSYTLDGTENKYRLARVFDRLNQARDEQLPLIAKFSEDVLPSDDSHLIPAFSMYLNDTRMFPHLVDDRKVPVWVDLFEFDNQDDPNDPLFVVDPVRIYGHWWNKTGKTLEVIGEDLDSPENVPIDKNDVVVTSLSEEPQQPYIEEVVAEIEQDLPDEDAEYENDNEDEEDEDEDEEEEEAHEDLRRKFKTIPIEILKALPDRVMVDALTYAFMASKCVLKVEAVPVFHRPWAIACINVTIPSKNAKKFIKSIRAHEAKFRAELQVEFDMRQAALAKAAERTAAEHAKEPR